MPTTPLRSVDAAAVITTSPTPTHFNLACLVDSGNLLLVGALPYHARWYVAFSGRISTASCSSSVTYIIPSSLTGWYSLMLIC